MNIGKYQDINIKHQIAPLIDVVFLLLIYFMVTASIIKKEGDIAFSLPVPGPAMEWPLEAYIQIGGDGSVVLEGMHFDKADRELKGLVSQVSTLRKLAEAQHSLFIVTLDPDDATLHRRVIDVLGACRDAKVKHLSFAQKKA